MIKLPQNLNLEKVIIGSMLISKDAALIAFGQIKAEDFYLAKNTMIFEAAKALQEKQITPDIVSIESSLSADGNLSKIGGITYLIDCIEIVPSTANITSHCVMLKELAIERRGIVNAEAAKNIFERVDMQHDEKIKTVRDGFLEILSSNVKSDFIGISDITKDVLTEWESKHGKPGIDGVPCGFTEIDQATLGWQPGDMIIIAANTTVGKTTLALNFAIYAASRGFPVGVFSLEMSAKQNVIRIISRAANINGHDGRRGALDDSSWKRLSNFVNEICRLPIWVDESSSLTTLDIYSKARRLISEHGVKLFVVDYIQKCHGVGRYNSQYEELTDISDRLKAIAKDLRVPIIAVSQFNRSGNQGVSMSKIKGSGGIEQDADIVLILSPMEDGSGQYKLDMEKNRNGPQTSIRLHFNPECLTFNEVVNILQ